MYLQSCQRPEDGLGSPGTGVTLICDQTYVFWKLKLESPEMQQMLLFTYPFSSVPFFNFVNILFSHQGFLFCFVWFFLFLFFNYNILSLSSPKENNISSFIDRMSDLLNFYVPTKRVISFPLEMFTCMEVIGQFRILFFRCLLHSFWNKSLSLGL